MDYALNERRLRHVGLASSEVPACLGRYGAPSRATPASGESGDGLKMSLITIKEPGVIGIKERASGSGNEPPGSRGHTSRSLWV